MSHTNLKLRQEIWPLSKAISLCVCVCVCVKLFRAMLACNNPPNPNPFSYSIHMCRERRGQSRKQSADKMLIMTRMRTPMTAITLMQRGEGAAAAAQFITSHLERECNLFCWKILHENRGNFPKSAYRMQLNRPRFAVVATRLTASRTWHRHHHHEHH